jgi:hypothetical protein
MTISPPYCGVPSLSHQLPVGRVLGAVVTLVVAGVEAIEVAELVKIVGAAVADFVVVDVVVEVAHDAKTRDDVMRTVSAIQAIPLFIGPPPILMEYCWYIDYNLIFEKSFSYSVKPALLLNLIHFSLKLPALYGPATFHGITPKSPLGILE